MRLVLLLKGAMWVCLGFGAGAFAGELASPVFVRLAAPYPPHLPAAGMLGVGLLATAWAGRRAFGHRVETWAASRGLDAPRPRWRPKRWTAVTPGFVLPLADAALDRLGLPDPGLPGLSLSDSLVIGAMLSGGRGWTLARTVGAALSGWKPDPPKSRRHRESGGPQASPRPLPDDRAGPHRPQAVPGREPVPDLDDLLEVYTVQGGPKPRLDPLQERRRAAQERAQALDPLGGEPDLER